MKPASRPQSRVAKTAVRINTGTAMRHNSQIRFRVITPPSVLSAFIKTNKPSSAAVVVVV